VPQDSSKGSKSGRASLRYVGSAVIANLRVAG
jgi:hypothetical protein